MKQFTVYSLFFVLTCWISHLLAAPTIEERLADDPVKMQTEVDIAIQEVEKLKTSAMFGFQTRRPKDWTIRWLKDCKAASQILQIHERVNRQTPSVSSPTRQWNSYTRLEDSVPETSAARSFADGPSGAVLVHSGEVLLEANDIIAPARGGVGFSLVRSYHSHLNYDGPLGFGWDHNQNIRILANKQNIKEASELTLLDGIQIHVFHRQDNQWIPEKGTFLKLEFDAVTGHILVHDAEKTIFDFEPFQSHWRILKVTSRIGNGKNALSYRYDSRSGQLQSVTDPFGNVFIFSYDQKGRLLWVQGNSQFVQYDYDLNGCLIAAKIPSVAIDLEKTTDSTDLYRWTKKGEHFLLQEVSTRSGKTAVRFVYSENRVIEAGVYALQDKAKNVWKFEYLSNQTRVLPPKPFPEKLFTFDVQRQHGSLPIRQEIPAAGAVWSYQFNEDQLLTQVITPDGQIQKTDYDSANSDPVLHGQVLREATIGNDSGKGILKECGTRTAYVPNTAFPSEITTWQIDQNGQETVLGTKTFHYSEKDFLLKEAVSFTVPTQVWHNSLGEPAIRQFANGSCTLYFYGKCYPQPEESPRFTEGSVQGSGLCVRVIEDASEQEIRKAMRELGVDGIQCNSHTVNEVTWNLYSARGELISQKTNAHIQFIYRNRLGDEVLNFDSQKGLTVTQRNVQFEKTAVFHPQVQSDVIWGTNLPGFTGKFFKETFVFNSLGQLVQYSPTDEAFGTAKESPIWRYERSPSGLILVMTNPMGTRRVTSYDACGRIKGVQLENGTLKTVLSSDYQYTPEGRILAYRNNHGEYLRTEYSNMGTAWKTIAPNETETVTEYDGLERIVSETTLKKDQIVAQTEFVYDQNTKLQRKTELQRFQDESRPLVVEEFRYDSSARVAASRHSHEDSWVTFLYDGLNRQIASRNAVGDVVINCFENGNTVYQKQIVINERKQTPVSSGILSIHDASDRLWLRILVDANGSLVDEQAVVTHSDLAGNPVFEESVGLSETVRVFDTRNQLCTQIIRPASRSFGEKDVQTDYGYDLAGNKLFQMTQNMTLGIFGTQEKPRPEFVTAPQTVRYSWDALGRQEEEIRPDGLKIKKTFNASSLVSEIRWIGTDNQVLRVLSFRYDSMQRPVEVRDMLQNKTIFEAEFDTLGKMIRSKDSTGKHEIVVERQFDSLGFQRTEEVFCDGEKFPRKEIRSEPESGIQTLTWEQASLPQHYWRNMSLYSDPAGRVTAMKLDHSMFCTWKFQGNQFVEREISKSQLKTAREINARGELVKIEVLPSRGEVRPRIQMNFSYGPHGELESRSSHVESQDGQTNERTQYYQYDSFQNVVSENQDAFLPPEVKARRDAIFRIGTDVTSHFTSQLRFDQAGNVWTHFCGEKERELLVPGNIPFENGPSYFSPGSILSDKASLSEEQLQELASNRCTTIAELQNDQLHAKEYEYDAFGCLTRYDGVFTHENGTQTPVCWHLKYDVLGRLASMEAYDSENTASKKFVAELSFTYDALNRRILKEVRESSETQPRETAFLYERNHPCLIFTRRGTQEWQVEEQYLWGVESQELLMTIVPKNWAEGVSNTTPTRYYLHQDQGFNVIASTSAAGSRIPIVSTASYLAFGENSTQAKIAAISSSSQIQNPEACWDRHLDESRDTYFSQTGANTQFLEIRLENHLCLERLNIFSSGQFPSRFQVFAIPGEEKSPTNVTLSEWIKNAQSRAWLLTEVQSGSPISLQNPYSVPLGGMRSNRLIITWQKSDAPSQISVREFQVDATPNNPGSIAFAGQWLDRETGLYYQLNRYRLPKLNGKFISPDPLGFADGINFYAYSHNNPLSWHDPDGEFAHILIGAGVGGVLGGSLYALNCWWNEEEFSWKKFGVSTFSGAVAGAVSAATFGLAPATIFASSWGGTVAASALAGSAGGVVHGMIQTTGMAKLDGNSWSQSLSYGVQSAMEEGTWGAVAGGISGGLTSVLPLSFSGLTRSAFSGTVGGGASGGVVGACTGYKQTGTLDGAWAGAKRGAVMGAAMGGVLSTAFWGVGRLSGKWVPLSEQPEGIPDPRTQPGMLVKQGPRPENLTYGNVKTVPGFERHHIKPLSLGGSDTPSNIEMIPTTIHRQPHPGLEVIRAQQGTIFY